MPLDNEPINPVDETNYTDPYQAQREGNLVEPNLPVNIDPMSFKENPGQMVLNNPEPIKMPKDVGKPGFFETFGHAAWSYNELVNAGKFIAKTADNISHLDDYKPEDWRSDTFDAINGYEQRYWPYIWDAVSPKDQQARQESAAKQMKDDAYFANGSMVANLAGGLAGGITSPSSWLIPMSAGIKYAKFGENIVKNMARAAPGMAAATIATEGLVQAGRAGGNFQDMAVDSFRDIVFGGALVGGAAGLGKIMSGGHLWDMRKTMNYSFKGVDINPVINEKGEFKGYNASPAPGINLSAAVVDEAQAFIDSSMKQSGAFKIPYVGTALRSLAGNKLLGSPIVRGLSSPYATVRGYIDRMASHSIETEGTASGKARADSAEDLLSFNRAEATAFSSQFKGLFYAANGLSKKDNIWNAIKDIKQTLSKDQQITFNDFGKAVRDVIYTGESHGKAEVNEAAQLTMDLVEKVGKEFTDSHGWEEGFLPPRTAVNYLMQNYNLAEIRNRPEEFFGVVADGYKAQDRVINELNAPVEEAQSRLKELQSSMKDPAFPETRALANEIAEAKGRLREARDSLVKQIEENPDHHILLEDRAMINSEEAEKIREITNDFNELTAEHESSKKELTTLKGKLSKLNQNIQKNVQTKTREKNLKKISEMEKRISEQEGKISTLEGAREEERLRLIRMASEGKINRKFYTAEEGSFDIKFRDPDALPKLRKPFSSDNERFMVARQLREKILGNTSEHLNQSVLGGMMGGAIESPQSTKARTVMLPSKSFNDANFLDGDIGKAVYAYSNTMGRHTALKKAFKGNQVTPGIDGVLKSLLQEKNQKEAKILEKKPSPERKKEIAKHQAEYDKEVQYMKDIHNVFMGNVGDPRHRRIAQNLKSFAASTMLGGVPLSQMTDLGAIVLKNTIFPFMMQGLRPALKSMNGIVKSEESEAFRKNSAHAYVAIQNLSPGYQGKILNSGSMSDMPAPGRIGSAIEGIAHVSGNLYGTNAIENLNQSMVANIFQSEVMAAAHDFKAGKMTDKQKRKMGAYGIDMNEWADRFIYNYKGANGWEYKGGFQSKYYDWADAAATDRMSRSIYRAVYDSVVQGGMFSSPLWTHNPILGLLATFHGWSYGAFARYTVPIMQRPDADAIMGVAMMFGLGLLEEPMRQFANGKEVTLDDDHLFEKAIDNSGVLSAWSDMFNAANMAMKGDLIPGMANERRREMTVLGSFGGPVASQGEIVANLLHSAWTGKISQRDVKQGARLLPGANHLLLRRYMNDFISSTSLPERSSDAESWPWWQSLQDATGN